MNEAFYISAAVALAATLLVVACPVAVHALLYFIVSLLAVAVMFYSMGAAFVAVLQVIIYAGAIMVLFIFVIMMLNLGPSRRDPLSALRNPAAWAGPSLLAAILLAEIIYVITSSPSVVERTAISPHQVGMALYGPYVLGVELASLLLLAGLVGAYHLARREDGSPGKEGKLQ
jgi:NADH-quinone oxidoreductase subunit J